MEGAIAPDHRRSRERPELRAEHDRRIRGRTRDEQVSGSEMVPIDV